MTIQFACMEIDQVRMVIILVLFLVAGIYSIYGGLASVAWTDVMQVTFLVGGGLITAYAALSVIGSERAAPSQPEWRSTTRCSI